MVGEGFEPVGVLPALASDGGLPEADYAKAVGHSPEVSRKFYLAKFEGAGLDDGSAKRFRAVAKKLAELLPA